MHKSLSQQTQPAALLPMTTKLGPVHIGVTNREEALGIWRDVLGLTLIAEDGDRLHMGVGDTVLVVLFVDAAQRVVPNTTGLYHVALHVPERRDLARLVARASRAGVRVSLTDHLVTEAIYLWDRDGNGIELTFETPWRGQLADPDSTGSYGIDTNGNPHSGREAIDVDSLMAELNGDETPLAPLPVGTRVGHMHLHVNDLDAAMSFYRDVLGFAGVLMMKSRGMGDVGLDYVPHTIAFNVWAGATAQPAPVGAAGLRWFTLVLPDLPALTSLQQRLVKAGVAASIVGDGIEIADPSQNRLRVVVNYL